MEDEKKILTVKELAKELGISISLAYRQVREKKIYSIKCGDRYLIPVRVINRLLSGNDEWQGRGGGDSSGGNPRPAVQQEDIN
jgi:excisionase family DNA binding protein